MTFQYQDIVGDYLLETLFARKKKGTFFFFFFNKGIVILIDLYSGPFKERVECSQFEYHVFVNISLLEC